MDPAIIPLLSAVAAAVITGVFSIVVAYISDIKKSPTAEKRGLILPRKETTQSRPNQAILWTLFLMFGAGFAGYLIGNAFKGATGAPPSATVTVSAFMPTAATSIFASTSAPSRVVSATSILPVPQTTFPTQSNSVVSTEGNTSSTQVPSRATPTLISMTTLTPPVPTLAVITPQSGESFQVPSKFLLFWQGGLTAGLVLRSGIVYFSDMKKFGIVSKPLAPYSNIITATITLLNNEQVVDQIEENYGRLQGPMGINKRDINISDVKQVDFIPSTSKTFDVPMAQLTIWDGSTEQVPACCLEAGYPGGLGGPHYTDVILLITGQEIAFRRIKTFEIIDSSQLVVTISLVDGSAITSRMDPNTYGLRGPTEIGPFYLDMQKVKQVQFPWLK